MNVMRMRITSNLSGHEGPESVSQLLASSGSSVNSV